MAEKKFSDLFAFDLDGTLVHNLPDGTRGISNELSQVIHDLSVRAHIVVATGRRYRAALRDLGSLPPMPFRILHNGLVIKDDKGTTIHSRSIDSEEAFSIGSQLKNLQIEFFVAVDGYENETDFIFERETLDKSQDLQSVHSRTSGFNRVLESWEEIRKFSSHPILELVSVSSVETLLHFQKLATQFLPSGYRALLVRNIGLPGVGALEIFPKNCSKWTGVEYVKAKLNADRVIAVGDDENDIEMIRSAHIGLVMDHAEPHVKSASARHISGPEGLTEYLRRFYK